MDKIIIHQLRLETVIGLYAWERQVKQVLFVDLEMGQDIAPAAAQDNLQLTLDYAAVCARITHLADQGRFKLIETLAEQIAALILTDFAAAWVRVAVHKVDALPQVARVGVVIERGQTSPPRT